MLIAAEEKALRGQDEVNRRRTHREQAQAVSPNSAT